MVLAFCMSSYVDWYLHEIQIPLKYTEVSMILKHTSIHSSDRMGQTDRGNTICTCIENGEGIITYAHSNWKTVYSIQTQFVVYILSSAEFTMGKYGNMEQTMPTLRLSMLWTNTTDNKLMISDILSLPNIARGSRKNSFSHASQNLKTNLPKNGNPDFGLKLFEKLCL